MEWRSAADEFVKAAYEVGVTDALGTLFEVMDHPSGLDSQAWVGARAWYAVQSDEAKLHIAFLLRQALIFGVFGLMAEFDVASGLRFINEEPARFGVSLHLYRTDQDAFQHNPGTTVEISPSDQTPDLHDLFMAVVDDSEG